MQRRIVVYLSALHAISPQDAVPYQPADDERAEFARMRAVGIIREVAAGYHWVDLPALRAEKLAREQRLAAIAGFSAVAIAGALILVYWIL